MDIKRWWIEKKSSRNRKIDRESLSKGKIFRWDVSYQIFSYSFLKV